MNKSENNKNIEEAKKFSLEMKSSALMQLILQRFQTLTIISAISFAVFGITISTKDELIKNTNLIFVAGGLFILIAFVSLGRYLFIVRSNINKLGQKIKSLPDEDWNKPLPEKNFKNDWWPETLFILLIISFLLFGLSFVDFYSICN